MSPRRRPRVAGLRPRPEQRAGVESAPTAAAGPRRRSDERPAAESVERRPASGAEEPPAPPEEDRVAPAGDRGPVDVTAADAGADGRPEETEESGREAEPDVSAAAAGHAREAVVDAEEEAAETEEPDETEESEKTEKPEKAEKVEDSSTTGRSGARGGSLVLPMALVAVAAVLAGLGTWFLAQAARYESDGAASNRALVDSVATSELIGQVTSAVEKVFSYNYNDTASTERAAQELLAGAAVEQYNELYTQVKELAPQQRVVLTTRVRTAGVSLLSGDRATVLLFADQQWSRLGEAEGDAEQQVQSDPVQLAVTVERQDGRWRITEIRPY